MAEEISPPSSGVASGNFIITTPISGNLCFPNRNDDLDEVDGVMQLTVSISFTCRPPLPGVFFEAFGADGIEGEGPVRDPTTSTCVSLHTRVCVRIL